ncbi:hypothetical protein [Xanthomonas cannabis]|uniref:hypothetical protein n=1 Tax=Xanthomonas cannabis TaxID=1885674 RepID=UPI000574CD5E|nr:hypothetical protein [Xanthomonas cannabis]KHL57459.1 hypothetical protein OZ13_06810 [Xanthomonas cannabis pv. cannabis]
MTSAIVRRPLTDLEASALQARCPADWDDLRFRGGEEGFDACDGPLRIEGELEIEENVLVVLGDLECDILFVNDIASLILVGRLRARAIIANGGVHVFGDLDCQTLVGLSGGNRRFGCTGQARVGALIEDGHTFAFVGRYEGDLIAPVFNLVLLPADARIARDFRAGMALQQMREAFVETVLQDDMLNVDSVCSALWKGDSPLR